MRIQHAILAPLVIAAMTISCAGPNYYFDKGAAPDWTRDSTSKIGKRAIRMIGAAPVTSQTQRDLDFAVRDAKARIGQLFVSEVKARTSDWSLSLQGGDHDGERQVTQQNIEVRTNVKVEDVEVESSFRDKATRTQYVAVSVNRTAWSAKLRDRVNEGLGQLRGKLDGARARQALRQGLAAYTDLQAGYNIGASIEPDLIIIDLLEPKLGLGKKLTALKGKLDGVNRELRNDFSFELSLLIPSTTISSEFNAKLEEFLNGYGFALGQQKTANVIRITAELGQKFVTKESVGNRIEFVHAALGKLRVTDADGSEVRSLSISLPARGYTERDTKRKAAAERALRLASDSLISKFRSQFRKTFQPVAD
jgi:hypothetical protein